jgi:hydroxymethylglutaryl-CoA lyase
MSEYDIFKANKRMPKKVKLAEISIRDGIQHEEVWIPTAAKIYYLQELAFAGVKRLEVTNLGNPRGMPQFKDAEEVFKEIRGGIFEKRLTKRGMNKDDIEWTAITIREPAVDRGQGY